MRFNIGFWPKISIFQRTHKNGLTIAELLIASSIAIIVVGGTFAIWFMTQDTWVNERAKSEILQKMHLSLERMKREIKISNGNNIFFHTGGAALYDAISIPVALDDGRSDTGYNAALDGDGFLETDSTTQNPLTGVEKIFWDKTVIYHVFDTGSGHELRRTIFYPRDNSLSSAQRQAQIDNVVALGTGNDATVPNQANWESTRALFKAKIAVLSVSPQLQDFDGYNSTIARTENLIDFGSTLLSAGYHTINFKVTGKNVFSSGYKFGIDGFQLTPSGGFREAEDYIGLVHPDGSPGINASSGDSVTKVNMYSSSFGLWSADYYLEYGANAVGDYLTLRFYYDLWRETTFLEGTSNRVIVEFSNIDGAGGTSGDPELLARMEGNSSTWDVDDQTNTGATGTGPVSLEFIEGAGDITYRNALLSKYDITDGMMLRAKFTAGATYPLTISSAYIIQRDSSGTGAPDDGSTSMPSIPVTFSNGAASVTIAAGGSVWSDWIQMYDNGNVNFNFDKMKDYFISIYLPTVGVGETRSLTYWEDTDITANISSYWRNGDHANTIVWGASGVPERRIYIVEEVSVTYVDAGSFISQIFDTTTADPAYNTIRWTEIGNSPDATLQISVRSNDSEATLQADAGWTTISGITAGSNPANISGIGTGRYVQFRADFAHRARTSGDAWTPAPYDKSSVLKNVTIDWPGPTSMVDIGGHFTKGPSFGKFTVEVDGQQLIKGYGITLTLTESLSTGANVTRSGSVEVEPRNTNK